MKKLIVIVLMCCGCQSPITALSNDGSKVIKVCGVCIGCEQSKCLREACPNGLDVITEDIVKCKP